MQITIEVPDKMQMEVLGLLQRIAQAHALADLETMASAMEVAMDANEVVLDVQQDDTSEAEEAVLDDDVILADDTEDQSFPDDEVEAEVVLDEEEYADELPDEAEDEGVFTREELESMRVQELRDLCAAQGIDVSGLSKKQILSSLFPADG